MTQTDLDALERAIVARRAESPARAKQMNSMLADEPPEDVGVFAVTCVQSRSLGLMPWQLPPFRANLDDLDKPYGDASGKRESAELLRRLLDAGLSIFEPDLPHALERAEAQRRQAAR